ncbi:COG4315 family predicted lipoprotein [Bordetella sp. 2513F-2]
MNHRLAVFLAAAPLWYAAAAWAQQPPAVVQDGVLVDARGMTLYTFDKDTAGSGKSACNDACAKAWPPLAAPADAKPQGDWSVVVRDDGSRQWAYRGQPVYLYASDAKPGDRQGDNFRSVWHVVKP